MPNEPELAYALVTPYTLHKSRTGGILARLLWGNVKLVAARMYAPAGDSRFIQEYCDAIYDPQEQSVPLHYQKLLIEYVLQNFGKPNARGTSNRLAVLIFRGPGAVQELTEAVGHISQHVRGDNVRGTYGDYVVEQREALAGDEQFEKRMRLLEKYPKLSEVDAELPKNEFFEPAVLTGVTPEMNEAHMKIFRKYAYSDGGFVLDALDRVRPDEIENSLVILKPESFRHRNPLPGNLIDFFARSGLFITAMKVMELTVPRAKQFYSLKLPQFREQLKAMIGDRARCIVERARLLAQQAVEQMAADAGTAFDPQNALAAAERAEDLFCREPEPGEVKPPVVARIYEELRRRLTDLDPPEEMYDRLTEDLKDLNARAEFNELIRYMTGKDPETREPLDPDEETHCMALLYSGPDALPVIRTRLKELREVYGRNVLQNRAHASDPDEDPEKELEVLGMPAGPGGESKPCDVERVVTQFYGPE